MNTIPQDQLAQQQLDRLAAQRQLYSDAKRIQAVQMFLAVPAVIALSFLGLWKPQLQVYGAFWGIAVALVDISFLTPWQRSLREQAAKIQEAFDCDVLQLDWPGLKAGQRPDVETITGAAKRYKRIDSDYSTLRPWYPVEVGRLPLHLARLVCQRANCWWDAELRRQYARWVIVTVCLVVVLVFLLGLVGGLTLERLVLAVLAPLLPALLLGLRQYQEHNESAAAVDRLKEHAETLWNQAIAGKLTADELARESRKLQDEIYDHRRRSALIFDWMYKRLRSDHEERMNKSANALVDEALKSRP